MKRIVALMVSGLLVASTAPSFAQQQGPRDNAGTRAAQPDATAPGTARDKDKNLQQGGSGGGATGGGGTSGAGGSSGGGGAGAGGGAGGGSGTGGGGG